MSVYKVGVNATTLAGLFPVFMQLHRLKIDPKYGYQRSGCNGQCNGDFNICPIDLLI